MSHVTANQPDGTPTWIDLNVPDLRRALDFYAALFGWEYTAGTPETGHYTTCLLHGRPVAGILSAPVPGAVRRAWDVYFATADCDGTAERVTAAGGALVEEPTNIAKQGRAAMAVDPTGARFGLWQGRAHLGCQIVNEPGALVRNDLVTPDPETARAFYTSVFDFTLDANEDLPDLDFTFLRRPDGHEIGGIFGLPEAPGSASAASAWATVFEVADTDETVRRARAAGGASEEPQDNPYGRIATVTDPFGTEFSVITRFPAA
ncbi:VOC family protein [Streptomyces sp. NPDC050617]|uniref:VOC family protein n=1 Tax=Streptomyces sp. NPDC050617 TaxID=3154628 RepID=UPI003427442D